MNFLRPAVLALCAIAAIGCERAGPAPTATAKTTAAPAAAATTGPLAVLDRYEVTARSLVESIASNAVDPATISKAGELIDMGAELTPAFVKQHPECKAYLAAAMTVRERLPQLDAETVERDFHDDGALPTEGISPACYHMKDLIVHPASTVLLLQQPEPDLADAKHEIDEVIAHLSVVRASFKQ